MTSRLTELPIGPTGMRAPKEILFGPGTIDLTGSIARYTGSRVFLCSDQQLCQTPAFERLCSSIRTANIAVDIFVDTPPDVPLWAVQQCIAEARASAADVVVGFGGGSSIDMAKLAAIGIAHDQPLESFYGENMVPGPCPPVIAIPTTAGTGSEVSPVAVIEDPSRRAKVGIASRYVVPTVAVCDPETTLSCPPLVTAYSGMDALVHAVESFTSKRRPHDWIEYPGAIFTGKNALSDLYAIHAIRIIAHSIERAMSRPDDLDIRSDLLYASLLAGLAFARSGTAGAHALQYSIGVLTNTPHGLGVALLLPYVLDFILPFAIDTLSDVAQCLGVSADEKADSARNAILEIRRMGRAVGIPTSLQEIGLDRSQLSLVAQQSVTFTRLTANSPRNLDEAALSQILECAFYGDVSEGFPVG